MAGFACHYIKISAVNPNLRQGGLQSQLIKEEVLSQLYAPSGNIHSRQRRVDAKHVHSILPEAAHCSIAQHIFHPAGSEDSKAQAVGDVVNG